MPRNTSLKNSENGVKIAPTSHLTRPSEQITSNRCLMYATTLGTEIHRHERPLSKQWGKMSFHSSRAKKSGKCRGRHPLNLSQMSQSPNSKSLDATTSGEFENMAAR